MIRVDDTGPTDLHEGRRAGGDPRGEDLRRGRTPDAHDDVGLVRRSKLLDAQQGVEGGNRTGKLPTA